MFKNIKILFITLVILFSSCASRKDLIYFQNDEINQTEVDNNYELTFKPDDLLQIIVSSDDLIAAQPFNLPVNINTVVAANANGMAKLQSYLIDKNGEIEFPVLGTLKLGGLTRIGSIRMIKDKLSAGFLKNPIVNITITNFKITLIGDVKISGSFQLPNERITILDALGLAGDLNISGRRDNVLVIREEGDLKKKYTLDLRSNKLLTSPAYYLQQNDVVYVEQNNAKVQDASFTRTTGLFISMASVLISLLTIITR
jgi:polysaccharide export outer membrane protein